MTAAVLLHAHAGKPAFGGCTEINESFCWLCAAKLTRGMPVNDWQGSNFTDQDKARSPGSTHVCEACCWACSWVQPPGMPDPEPGKKGLNLRLFSHLFDDRGYLALNKASKPAIRSWLREQKHGRWFAAIADSGQKHVLPWTPVNPGSYGRVRFEDRDLALPRDESGWVIVDVISDLLTAGVTKDEIESGRYSMLSAQQSAAEIRAFEIEHGSLRTSRWFDLALWLAQRDEEKSNEIKANRVAKRVAAKQARDDTTAVPCSVPARRSKPTKTLGPDARQDAGCGASVGNDRTDAHIDGEISEPVHSGQLNLFGDAVTND